MEPNKTNSEKRPLACEPSILSVPSASVSPAIAEKIVTAIEGRFLDWLMDGEHEEAKQLVAEILERELDGWTHSTDWKIRFRPKIVVTDAHTKSK